VRWSAPARWWIRAIMSGSTCRSESSPQIPWMRPQSRSRMQQPRTQQSRSSTQQSRPHTPQSRSGRISLGQTVDTRDEPFFHPGSAVPFSHDALPPAGWPVRSIPERTIAITPTADGRGEAGQTPLGWAEPEVRRPSMQPAAARLGPVRVRRGRQPGPDSVVPGPSRVSGLGFESDSAGRCSESAPSGCCVAPAQPALLAAVTRATVT
jgi:hypothetical protein